MSKVIQDAVKQAREDMTLRGITTPSITQHYERIKRSMYEEQTLWGGNLTVINPETQKVSATIRRSLAFEKSMREMPIFIEPYALLAGRCEKDGLTVRCMIPSYIIEAELGQCALGIAHKTPDYETLLGIGLSGILDNLEKSKNKLISEGAFDDGKRDFYEAVRRECLAMIHFANRYADLAESQGMTELAKICRRVPEFGAGSFYEAVQSIWIFNHCIHETMIKLPIGNIDRLLYPYFEKDFVSGKIDLKCAQELVDAFVLRVNDRARIDPQVYVKPHNELDGKPEKHFRASSGQGFVEKGESDDADAINHWGQNILISGLCADGSDATNPLTYMFLNAHEKFSLTSPVLSIRLHKGSPPELIERASEVLKTGGGMPYINNDDIIVPAYEKLGVTREDACWYANSNCWETLIQGRSNQEMVRFINFLYALELTLNNGKPIVLGKTWKQRQETPETHDIFYSFYDTPGNPVIEGLKTGSAASFTSIKEIMDAWKKQMEYMLDESMKHVAAEVETNGSHGKYSSMPILSAVIRDCIGKMTDLTHDGSRYTLWHMLGEAVSNAADALSAIQKFVFEEKLLTLEQLVDILNNNWEGEEALRQRFLSDTPRFGNGLETPDNYAKEMVDFFVERVEHHAKKYSACIFSPSIGTFSWVISIGRNIGASADGRMCGEAIAANMSPVAGADISGPIPAIQSYLKLQTGPMAAGAPMDLRISNRGLEGPEGTNRIVGIIKTFLQQGGNMLTLTVTSVEELRHAMAEPDKYRSLRVRMGGWSAYFTLLSKEAQELQLRRAESTG